MYHFIPALWDWFIKTNTCSCSQLYTAQCTVFHWEPNYSNVYTYLQCMEHSISAQLLVIAVLNVAYENQRSKERHLLWLSTYDLALKFKRSIGLLQSPTQITLDFEWIVLKIILWVINQLFSTYVATYKKYFYLDQ